MKRQSPEFLPSVSRRHCLTALAALPALASAAGSSETDSGVTDLWQRTRAQWLLGSRQAYFDTATMAPSLRAVLATEYRALEALHSDPRGFYASRYSAPALQDLLGRVAQWLGCDADEACAVRSSDAALVSVANLLTLSAGDEIVLAGQLPDALMQAWWEVAQRRGCRVVTVDLPMPIESRDQALDAFRAALSEHTKVLCISHVQSLDGSILPVRELCGMARERGITTLVEGSLALGALQVNLRELGCDVYAGSLCHWVQGASPSAALYVRREVQATWPVPSPYAVLISGVTISDWPKLQQRWPTDLIELGAQFQALPTALQWHASLGRSVIENRLRQLQTYLRINLQNQAGMKIVTSNQPGMQLHILSLRPEARSAMQVSDWLQRNDNVSVGVAGTIRNPAPVVRIALNVGNSLDEVDRLIQGLKRALRAA